ncbi:MAG: PAS domain-containing protein, partial [Saprospiraceae bacterium]|nr:PAS domain-containing protein [Saprospiraceae bacterium]
MYSFAGFVHPQDLLLYQQSVAKCFQEGTAFFEGRLITAQGQAFWGEVMLRFLKNEDDEFAQLILRDLSNVRQEQNAYRELKSRIERIGESTPNLMLYQFLLKTDGQMSFPYVSAGSIDVYGIPCQEVMQDVQKLLDAIHPDDIASFQTSLQGSAAELSDWVWEGRSYYRGVLRWIRGNARPERLADGSVLWTGAVMNITERKQAEEEVKILSLVA